MEKGFDEVELKQRLAKLVFWKQLVFLLIVCQRLLPSFGAFSKDVESSGKNRLHNSLKKAWSSLLRGEAKADFSNEMNEAESLAPETEDFDSIYVSSALDAAVAISLLMKSFCENNTDTIVEAVTLICDSVDMYVQELENMDTNDPNLEGSILDHQLMQKELKRQREDLEFIEALDDNNSISMAIVKNKWFDREDSCLDLT